MRTKSLLLEHRHSGRVLKRLRLAPSARPMVLGSNLKADLRLVGAEVSPFHAVIECRKDRWFVFDFGSTTGTWLNGETINEFEISKEIVIKIGLHELLLLPQEPMRELFAGEEEDEEMEGLTHHQIVVRTPHGFLDSMVQPKESPFRLSQPGEPERVLVAPTKAGWLTHQVGPLLVQQRLVKGPQEAQREPLRLDGSLRWPAFISSIGVLIFAVILGLQPKEEAMPSLPELESNRFANLVLDAKVMVEKRKDSKRISEKTFKSQGSQKGGPGSGGTPQTVAKNTPGAKLISQVKASGLAALIGRVANRAPSNVALTQQAGLAADSHNAGRTIASVGVGAMAGSGAGHPQGEGFKLAAVGTGGKGGGGNYKSGVGLGNGNIGKSSVGIIEEESEVTGGLDKNLILEVIKSELGQIRYCYERQLAGSPELYGKVLIKFTIGSAGLVVDQKIGNTTLNNADVEGCILRRVARWKFPQPNGGTTVVVSYPFLFKSTN